MSIQASLSRICLRCRIRIFPSGFGQSVPISNSGYLFRHSSSSFLGRPSARGFSASLKSRSSSTEPGSRETPEVGDIQGKSPNEKKAVPDVNLTNPEGFQRSHPLVMTDTIANLDAESFVSAAKARIKSAAEAEKEEPFDPLSQQADEDFLKSYRSLLSDTRRDIRREMSDSEGLPEISQESIKTPERLKRKALFWKSASDANKSWPAALPSALKGVASKFNFPPATHRVKDLSSRDVDQVVTMHGFLTHCRIINKKLTFANFFDFYSGSKFQIQVVSNLFTDPTEDQIKAQEILLSIAPFTPISLTGKVFKRESTKRSKEELESKASSSGNFVIREFTSRYPSEPASGNVPTFLEIQIESLQKLNSVAKDLIYTPDTVFPPEQRHLQLRTKRSLYCALRLRAKVASICRTQLERNDFLEVETPLLFKSTPEGAREFLVPTRSKDNGGGMCYALPQSPQQYKQILMASGVARYFQLAKCFRDEDLRADRQPEFTQLDLEMSFATGEDVIGVIEDLLNKIWLETLGIDLGGGFQRMTWWYAMKFYGSDKPDLRFPKSKINEITSILPHLLKNKDEHIEVLCLHTERGSRLEEIEKYRASFEAAYKGEGEDHFLSYVVGHPSAHLHPDLIAAKIDEEKMVEINRESWASPGCILLIKVRKGDWSGGSTALGVLRTALLAGAQRKKLVRTPDRPEFVWIIDFPLFSPSSDSEPGQSGTAGLSSTHHPFTAPNPNDLAMLASAPAKVRGEHYDIVVNGVELGGGSRRIHDAALQKYVLEEVLKIDPSRIHQFDHLLKVLDSGCPPHAGIALGFDRLIAILQGTDSVRDVIAFPKSAKGADLLVGSPSLVSDEDLEAYHLKKRTDGRLGQE